MDIRKVQLTGGSSYVITLPKEWAESMHIQKNDPLGVYAQTDGTLLITKNITDTQVQRQKRFDTTTISDPHYLFRLLIAAYIAGYSVIQITNKGRLPSFVRTVVRDFAQMTIGFEVVEESDSAIMLKDLLNPAEMPFDNSVRRMHVIVKNMYIDAIMALETQNASLARDVIARDNDVDRLHWLIARQTNIVLKQPNLARKMGISTGAVVNIYIICRIIERIGDHAVRVAENGIRVIEHMQTAAAPATPLVQEIKSVGALSLSIFDRSIISYFKSDIGGSNRNIESVAELEERCGELAAAAGGEPPETGIPLRHIAESLRRAGEYAGDISENVINHLVEEKI